MSNKGSDYERDLCRTLSLWWTGDRDDVFWRTAGSGARAKARGRQGKDTEGQHGDIGATDPIGKPLIDLITFEIKRGYNSKTIADLLDAPKSSALQVYERWINQASESAAQAHSFAWALIVKRDQRDPFVITPAKLWTELVGGASNNNSTPRLFMTVKVRREGRTSTEHRIVCVRLKTWLAAITPVAIRRLLGRLK
jgi:hypothetical protein